jgi:hypothetical protein
MFETLSVKRLLRLGFLADSDIALALPMWMIAPQFPKFLWALQEPAFPARLFFGRRRQIGVLIYNVASDIGCLPRFTFCCCVISGPRRSRSDKGGRIARRECFFESFVNAALTAFRGSQFLYFAHQGQQSGTCIGSSNDSRASR